MKIKTLYKRFLAFFPEKLPQGLAEFNKWSDDIIELYGVPNNDSVKFSLAVMVLHLESGTAYKPKEYFGRALYKASANQVVSQVIQDLKEKQKREVEKAQAEVTAQKAVTPNELQPIQN